MRFLYAVKSIEGLRVDVEADTAEEAVSLSRIPPDQVCRWFPFPLKRILTEEEKRAQAKRLAELRESKGKEAEKDDITKG